MIFRICLKDGQAIFLDGSTVAASTNEQLEAMEEIIHQQLLGDKETLFTVTCMNTRRVNLVPSRSIVRVECIP